MDGPVGICSPQTEVRLSIKKELATRREYLTKQLEDIDTVIKMFEKNPDLEVTLSAIGRLNIHL